MLSEDKDRKLKKMFGESNSYSDMSDEERNYFVEILKEEIDRRERSGRPEQIREIVPMEEFLTPYYLGDDAKKIFPYWRDFLCDMFDNKREEENRRINTCVLSGCFTGDTKVSLLDGRELSFIELEKEYGTDKYFWVYSCDKDSNIVPGLAHNVHKTKVAKKLCVVTLDNGEIIKCTPDHLFLTRSGEYKRADSLQENDSLMPLYREYKRMGKFDSGTPDNYERFYNPSDNTYYVTHRVVSSIFSRDRIESLKKKFGEKEILVTHHKNFNRRDNTPDNLIVMTGWGHTLFHRKFNKLTYWNPYTGEENRKKLSEAMKRNWENHEYRERLTKKRKEYTNSEEYLNGHWKYVQERRDEYLSTQEGKEMCARNIEKWNKREGFTEDDVQEWKNSIGEGAKRWWNSEEGEKEKKIRSERTSRNNLNGQSKMALDIRWNGPNGKENRRKEAERTALKNKWRAERIIEAKRVELLNLGVDLKVFEEAVRNNKTWSGVARYLNENYRCNIQTTSHMNTVLKSLGISNRKEYTDSLGVYWYEYRNHKVVSIEIIDADEWVYDLEVDAYHNFALSSGVFVHNSIGTGKSTVAEIILLRKLYEISCYKNINAYFGLMASATITFIYFSLNKATALATGFSSIRAWVDNSTYFNRYFPRRKRLDSLLLFPEGVTIAYGSRATASTGRNVLCSIMDEANFINSMGDNASGNIEMAVEMFTGLVNRSNSRFILQGGDNHSLNILVSSSTHNNSATERIIRASEDDVHAIVATPSQWDVKPENFSKEFFYVLKGTKYMEPQIIRSTDDINSFRIAEGLPKSKFVDNITDFETIEKEIQKLPSFQQSNFLKVPIDLKRGFEMNIIRSLQDMGGVSTGATGKLFNSPAVFDACIDERLQHPFIQPEIVISTGDKIEIKDYLRNNFRFKNIERPRFIHIDQSYRTDSTGISCVYVSDVMVDEETGARKPIFSTDFMLRINPPKPPRKIAIYKIRNFVVYLAQVMGLKIGKVTYDIFNSEESRQILEEMGFNVGYQSVDRNDEAYLSLVEIMYEGRLKFYDYPILRHEIFNLIHNREKRKVDHPKTVNDSIYNGKGENVGSKDVSDSLCGSIFSALKESIIDEVDERRTLDDFLRANQFNSYLEADAFSAEEMINKEIDEMIEQMEINGYTYGGMSGFGGIHSF